MNFKKKPLILIFCLIISIQTLLFINNRQKTSFRYFIWNLQNISVGRIISISFISGLLISSILNNTQNNYAQNLTEKEENNNSIYEDEEFINKDINSDSYEKPPERDLRDTQPTISVNYRVIKDNYENELKDKKNDSMNNKYKDDWYNNDSEW